MKLFHSELHEESPDKLYWRIPATADETANNREMLRTQRIINNLLKRVPVQEAGLNLKPGALAQFQAEEEKYYAEAHQAFDNVM